MLLKNMVENLVLEFRPQPDHSIQSFAGTKLPSSTRLIEKEVLGNIFCDFQA